MSIVVEKECTRCGEASLHHVRDTGKVQAYCITCTRAYSKAHYEAHREQHNARRYVNQQRYRQEARKIVDELKSVPCADCGLSYPPWVMDFDHLDADAKLANVGDMIGRGAIRKLLAEVEKCEVVCSNCHRVRTWNRSHAENAA